MTVPPSLGDWDGSLGAAEQALRAAAERLMAGDESVQAEFDKWDKRIAGARGPHCHSPLPRSRLYGSYPCRDKISAE